MSLAQVRQTAAMPAIRAERNADHPQRPDARPDSRPAPDFALLRSFSLMALVSVVVIWGTTSVLVSRFVEHHLVARDALVLQQIVSEITLQHDPASWFADAPDTDRSALGDFFSGLVQLPDIGRIDAYASNGALIWSTAQDGAAPLQGNAALKLALTGRPSHVKEDVAAPDQAAVRAEGVTVDWIIRHYIPIADPTTQRVFGVVELYRIPIALERAIRDGRWLVWLCELGGGLFLYLALFWIVRRADRLIRCQQRTLLDHARLATIGEMAASVAHSIRNPIASIRSSAELALHEGPPRAIADGLKDIVDEVERFDGWIRELLTFAGEQGDPRTTCEIAQIVDGAIGDFGHRAARRGVRIEARIADALPPVRGEARLLAQVLHSLFANALDAMPQGGDLIVDAAKGGSGVRLAITDTGFGIPPERVEGLFDPLVTHKQGGLGIGLALARRIIERAGGRLGLHSAVGIGTSVVLELAVGEVSPWSAEAPNLHDLEVELVDDTGTVVDQSRTAIGFRRVEVRGHELLVNGQPVLVEPQTRRIVYVYR